MQGNNIALSIQAIQIHILHLSCQFLFGETVIGHNAATKAAQILNQELPYMTCAHYAHGAITQILAHFSLQGIVLSGSSQHGLLEFTNATQNQHQRILSHTFRRIRSSRNMHSQLLNQLAGQMVIANSTGQHVLNTVAVIGTHPFLSHLAGSAANAIAALGQLQIVLVGIFRRPHKIDAILFAKLLSKGQFIKITQSIKSDFHYSYSLICKKTP